VPALAVCVALPPAPVDVDCDPEPPDDDCWPSSEPACAVSVRAIHLPAGEQMTSGLLASPGAHSSALVPLPQPATSASSTTPETLLMPI
jgi:hypothetical protein